MEGIPDPHADPPGAAPAGVTADVHAGMPLAFASNLGRSGGDAIVVSLPKSTPERRGDSRRLELNKPTNDRVTDTRIRALQRPESRAAPPEIVAVLGTTTLVRRPAEVTSCSARSDEGTPLEIDPQPSLPPTGGDDHGKAQGGIVVQSTVGFIKRRRGRPPHCQ